MQQLIEPFLILATVAALFTCAVLSTGFCEAAEPVGETDESEDTFIKGADISLLQCLEDGGGAYKEAGEPKDAMLIFKDHGFNYVRLRLFLDPDGTLGQVNDLPYTLKLARRAKGHGFKFLLNFHYSDKWADPTKQITPAAWKDLSHTDLVKTVFEYTRDVVQACRDYGCMPVCCGLTENSGRVPTPTRTDGAGSAIL